MKQIITQSSNSRCSRGLSFSRHHPAILSRPASSQPQSHQQNNLTSQNQNSSKKSDVIITKSGKKKTMAELDAELQQNMSGLSGDGGESGIEYEDGKPVAMKRGVKNNMFRYI